MSGADRGSDLLAAPADNLVSVHYVLSALRRERRLLAGLAVVGIVVGLVLGAAVPHPRTARTALLLQFPTGADPSRAIATDVSLLQTRAVAAAAVAALHLHESTTAFQATYRGTVLSDSVLQISVKAPDASEAIRRGNALSRAFLQFRKQTYEYQLSVVNRLLGRRKDALQVEVATTNREIASFDGQAPTAAEPGAPSLSDLLTERASQLNDIAQTENEMQRNTIATTTVVGGSRVIDPAAAVPASALRTIAVDVGSALVAALALGAGGITLVAVVSTRVRRRADIAAALRAPVLLSVGRLGPPLWLRAVRRAPGWSRVIAGLGLEARREPPADANLVVRHLQTLMRSAPPDPSGLVVVAIGRVDGAALAVGLLRDRWAEAGQAITLVNETGVPLPAPAVVPPLAANGADEHSDGTRFGPDGPVVVVAVLDPAKGAEHLREWASDAVAIVTAGAATTTALESNASMIKAAGLRLRSVVLVGSDVGDDSLGTFDSGEPFDTVGGRPVAVQTPAAEPT